MRACFRRLRTLGKSALRSSDFRKRSRLVPTLGELEERTLLSLTIKIDYTYDSSNFFDTPAKRNVMEAAANSIGSVLNDNLLAIQASGSNSWMAHFPNPSNGQLSTINNLVVPTNTIVIFVGGRALPAESEAAEGSSGGFSAQGSQTWLELVSARGQAGALAANPTDFGPWGGSISFDNSGATNWFYGQDTNGLNGSQTDFRTVAEHEIGHVLGVGTSPSWSTFVSAGTFVGPASMAVGGGQPVPLDPHSQHWAPGTKSDGVDALMDPTVQNGLRRTFTSLDYAGLKDIGWNVQPPILSVFQFGAPSYTVSKTSGSLLVTVQRSGGSGAASVAYATSNGTATAGVNYTSVSGTLNFAPGQTVQSFVIPILNDQIPDGNKTVNLVLGTPSATATLGFPSTAVVTIIAPGNHPIGDYDGVGFTQVGIFRPSNAMWTILNNTGGRGSAYGASNLFDIPVPGDYDGIGRTEQAVFRPSTGQWIILNPINQTQRVIYFGGLNLFDIPVPGDYDGIGRTQPAVFRPSTGQWIIFNPITNTQRVAYYGAADLFDIPVPGDYDGIGRTQLAVFRPSTATWAIYNPLTNTQRFVSYGAANLFDIPVPGDYDGVGRTEMAVFRPSNGQWVILNPIDQSQRLVYFGATNYFDIPLQAPIASLKKLGKLGGNSLTALSTTSHQQTSVSASAFTAPSIGEAPSVPAELITGDDQATSSLPRRKPSGQSATRLAWLDPLEGAR
ncbi:Calx-beta domain-containing protein [Singulisphaera acidiphila]|uniref:Calx-beta domain-containing protein n=1 Tax=Singulisphaera acidiphila (strain ATCC BAA-1392 / DSM 18658 / VKM B-2454 / MOB10) TaxID=886293 RepID=L0DLP4_SINAD|nr:Calx-beta domain-containing protein [Singulisphaera acidiphila]AGA29745.1 Calx-beta domain-containing protein [Singulisphaera acidiphila DSM 18658]